MCSVIRLFASACAPLILAACLSDGPPNSTVVPTPTAPVAPAAVGNVTGCLGHYTAIFVDEGTAEGLVPAPYNPQTSLPEVVVVGVWAVVCEKVAVRGVDLGPADFFIMDVPIETPGENPPPTGHAAMFLLDYGSSATELAGLAAAVAETARSTNVASRETPLPDLYRGVEGEVLENSTELYSWAGVSSDSSRSDDFGLRLYGRHGFLGPTIDLDARVERTVNDGPGQFRAHESTRLGGALPQGTGEAVVSRVFSFDGLLTVNENDSQRS